MVAHVVLFRPRADVGAEARERLLDAMRAAARGIPSVKRFHIGEHLADPPTYVMGGFPPFPYIALLEFDDEAGLREYLAHSLHVDLGARFNATAEAALIYDFRMNEV